MKACSKCKVDKELTEFRTKNNKPYSWCRACEQGYDKSRYSSKKNTPTVVPLLLPHTPTKAIVHDRELPEPDQLPAPYVKRVYEMWKSLIGESSSGTRIA